MENRYLVVIEVSQKQSYIFKTNELKQNVGASIIIRDVTEVLASSFCDEKEQYFSGGGKAAYEFESKEKSVRFIRKLSSAVKVLYPGIELFAGVAKYDIDNDPVPEAFDEAFTDLDEKKRNRKQSYRLYDLGIAELSKDSQMPISVRTDGDLVSVETSSKLLAADRSEQRNYFKKILKVMPENSEYDFPFVLDELGITKGSKSYLAVIVSDGNRMGQMFQNFKNNYADRFKKAKGNELETREVNESYRKDYKELSSEVDKVFCDAVRETNEFFIRKIPQMTAEDNPVLSLKKKNGRTYLPIRPIVVAGDDVCVVTDARIGFSYAKLLLENIEKLSRGKSVNEVDIQLYACAGVALIPSHYPFFRAHELAEQLCNNAKKQIPALPENTPPEQRNKGNASLLDFHIVQGEIEGDIDDIRDLKYDKGNMTDRPYYLFGDKKPIGVAEWSSLLERLNEFVSCSEEGKIGRNAFKQYREAIADGEEAMKAYYNQRRLAKRGLSECKSRGLDFDAIEIMDIYHDVESL